MSHHNNPWQVLERFAALSRYSNDELQDFTLKLEDTDEPDEIIKYAAFISRAKKVLEVLEEGVRPLATQIVMNVPEKFEAYGVEFVYVQKTQYLFNESKVWLDANEDVGIAKDYQKQVEEACKKGGRIGDIKVTKVGTKKTDGYRATEVKPKD